ALCYGRMRRGIVSAIIVVTLAFASPVNAGTTCIDRNEARQEFREKIKKLRAEIGPEGEKRRRELRAKLEKLREERGVHGDKARQELRERIEKLKLYIGSRGLGIKVICEK
ncbi:MAG: hypothetical protein ACKO8P_01685, partial [Actinomycetota bacterium]